MVKWLHGFVVKRISEVVSPHTGSNPVLTAMSKGYSADLSMSHLNLIGYWTGHP